MIEQFIAIVCLAAMITAICVMISKVYDYIHKLCFKRRKNR